MRKLGMIGGMSWVSTRDYYERINRGVRARTSPMASAPLLIESLDFEPLWGLNSDEDWRRAGDVLAQSAERLVQAGAEGLIICANSMHKVYDQVAAAAGVPVLHIAECVGDAMHAANVTGAVLIGTRNVMTERFYRERLVAHGVDLLPPDMDMIEEIDRIIYQELMRGKITRDAERTLKTWITRKEQDGAEAVVLACTELAMIVDVDANVLPVFDSTRIHCNAAVDWMLATDN
ncbi:amino acid racemase [Altererythrobacter sp. TH136]|uniref:aspartate/glutamate racemase family protein n=1 Tax=Altererythrobacter sp. TH136 TaxID=2067415 RepID=UPI0011652683|nr:amino acid racemase [Altererythrobacter sp. TH136]QDM41725.1 amino acid racemase [Altererythrobacter sp. TH136]